ncbi:hypothetical protein ACRJ4W_44785 [Streptomyces sp. GLT-R25]
MSTEARRASIPPRPSTPPEQPSAESGQGGRDQSEQSEGSGDTGDTGNSGTPSGRADAEAPESPDRRPWHDAFSPARSGRTPHEPGTVGVPRWPGATDADDTDPPPWRTPTDAPLRPGGAGTRPGSGAPGTPHRPHASDGTGPRGTSSAASSRSPQPPSRRRPATRTGDTPAAARFGTLPGHPAARHGCPATRGTDRGVVRPTASGDRPTHHLDGPDEPDESGERGSPAASGRRPRGDSEACRTDGRSAASGA